MFWESAGSPLDIRRIFDYLIAHGYPAWQPSGWAVDMDRIRALRIPGGAASILMEKVDALPRRAARASRSRGGPRRDVDVDLLTQRLRPPAERDVSARFARARRERAARRVDERHRHHVPADASARRDLQRA